jgi:hypothetical protein
MTWVSVAFFVAAAIIIARIYFKIRNIRSNKQESWDAKIIEQLRSKGYAPFNEYKVDFFIALPEKTDLAYSLHASKSMRLIVPDMQAMSERLTALAGEFGGRYDGWTA